MSKHAAKKAPKNKPRRKAKKARQSHLSFFGYCSFFFLALTFAGMITSKLTERHYQNLSGASVTVAAISSIACLVFGIMTGKGA